MLNSDFAYSSAMQVILIVITCVTTIILYSYITNTILLIYGEKVSLQRKAIFIFLAGTVMNNAWTYAIYFLGGRLNFTPLAYNLITVPNPVFALLFYFLGIKVLNLAPYRSLRLMLNAYIYIMLIKIFQRMISFTLLPQSGAQWNYMIDAVMQVVSPALYTIIYIILKRYIMRSDFSIRLADSTQSRPLRQEILSFFMKITLIYLFFVLYPMYANTSKDLYLFIMFVVMALALAVSLLIGYLSSMRAELSNKSSHVKNQNSTIDGFSGLRHDLNNILHAYGGYIATENMEKLKEYHKSLLEATVMLNDNALLTHKLDENPALISLIMCKVATAGKELVRLRVNITCKINELFISELDMCCAVGNLLDNAIEAASQSTKRWVDISIEEKSDASKLIVISNSTSGDVDITSISRAGVTSKASHTGMGLNHTRKILSAYNNCSFQISYYDHEFSAYINVSKSGKTKLTARGIK